jgi:hypothetical protein
MKELRSQMNSESQRVILVSSDISAHGVEYRDVTIAILVGYIIISLPKRKEKKRKESGFIKKFICSCRLVCLLIENSVYT